MGLILILFAFQEWLPQRQPQCKKKQLKQIRIVIKAKACKVGRWMRLSRGTVFLCTSMRLFNLVLLSFVIIKKMTMGVKMKYPGKIKQTKTTPALPSKQQPFNCWLDLPNATVQPFQVGLSYALPGKEIICRALKLMSRHDDKISEEEERAWSHLHAMKLRVLISSLGCGGCQWQGLSSGVALFGGLSSTGTGEVPLLPPKS